MFKPKSVNDRIIHRLKIARGHMDKVIRMVEDGEYCIDTLHQSHAVQKALKESDAVILENHMHTCMADAIKKGNDTMVIKEVMEILKRQK